MLLTGPASRLRSDTEHRLLQIPRNHPQMMKDYHSLPTVVFLVLTGQVIRYGPVAGLHLCVTPPSMELLPIQF